MIHTEVVSTAEGGFELRRDGEPYVIRGVGGDMRMDRLPGAGANSIRTWGVGEGTGRLLDRAHAMGLTVTLGIWLQHPRHEFNYNNLDAVAQQFEDVRKAVLKHRDHPALLMWGLGNEVHLHGHDTDAALWSHTEAVAAMVKRLDPHHPTMTVVAEVGGRQIEAIHRMCPSIDVVGINTYGGAATVAERYREAGGTKPYVITEFGPNGRWESPSTAWGAPIEPSSTAKATSYRTAWTNSVEAELGQLALGGYAFLWGHKQEATSTWFGMLLPNGYRTEAVDVMHEMWTGSPPTNRVPEIRSLALEGFDRVLPGSEIVLRLDATDPDGDALRVYWAMVDETTEFKIGGDEEDRPEKHASTLMEGDLEHARFRVPEWPGGYRVFAHVYDDANEAAAVANVPILVTPDPEAEPEVITNQ